MLNVLWVTLILLCASPALQIITASAHPLYFTTAADAVENSDQCSSPTLTNLTYGNFSYYSRRVLESEPSFVGVRDLYHATDTLLTRDGSKLSPRCLNITYIESGADAIRLLRTPWMLVGAQCILAQVLLIYGSKSEHIKRPAKLKVAIWVFSALRGVVSVIYQVIDLVNQNRTLPSVGVAVNYLTLLASSYAFAKYGGVEGRLFSYGGVFISTLGQIVFTVNGIIALVAPGPGAASIELIIGVGCPGGYQDDQYGICSTTEDMLVVYQKTVGDWLLEAGWIIGAFFLFLMVLIPFFYHGICKFKIDLSRSQLVLVRWTTFCVNSIGGILGWVGTASTGQYSSDLIDCSQATHYSDYYSGCFSTSFSLSGSSTGFWDIWAQDKAAIARSVFTW